MKKTKPTQQAKNVCFYLGKREVFNFSTVLIITTGFIDIYKNK